MPKKYHYQYNQQEITPDKKARQFYGSDRKKCPYPSIIAHFAEKVNSKTASTPVKSPKILTKLTQKFQPKPLEPGLKLPKNYELKAIKLTSLALTTFLITLFAASILAPVQPSQAAEVLMGLQTTNSTISLTTSGNINLSMTAGSAGAVRTVQDTVTVTAGDSGYQLYVGTANSTNALIRDGATSTGTDSTTGLPTYTSSDLIPASLITNISEPDVLSNDTWGFAVAQPDSTSGSGSEDVVENGFDASYPTGDNSSASSKFIAVPAHGNDVLIAERSTSADAVPTNVYYGARATSAKPSGLYKNTIVYTAIGNGSTTGLASVSPSRTKQISGGETLTITTPSTLDLSSIAGTSVTVGGEACTNSTATKASDNISVNITCTSPALATGWHEVVATITTTAGSTETYTVSPGIEYYANQPNEKEIAQINAITAIAADSTNGTLDLSDIITMQQFSSSVCKAMKQSTPSSNANKNYTLKDARDQKTYNVAKLDDGLCWMVQNLRLGESTAMELTADDTNITPSNYDSGKNYWATPTVQTSGSYSSWSSNSKHIYQQSDIDYGNLYNWYTATAGTGTSSISSGDATASICPKGWVLPSGGTGIGSFKVLTSVASIGNSSSGSAKLRSAPYLFTRAGYYSSSLNSQGSHGYYLSSTAYAATFIYVLYFGSETVAPQHNGGVKSNGYSVRCVFSD